MDKLAKPSNRASNNGKQSDSVSADQEDKNVNSASVKPDIKDRNKETEPKEDIERVDGDIDTESNMVHNSEVSNITDSLQSNLNLHS